MPFLIDKETLLIRGRQGDSAAFTFNFNEDISNYDVHFYVKQNLNSSAVILDKEYTNLSGNSVTVKLTADETKKLFAPANTYATYYWGLKIANGTTFATTVIPNEFANPPKMYIYPEIGGV